MLSNAYFLAKFRFDTAENEPAKILQKFANFLQNLPILLTPTQVLPGHGAAGARVAEAAGREDQEAPQGG